MRYEHSADMGWKSDSEGSLHELIFGYGLRMEELPNDMPPAMRAKIRQLLAVEPVLIEVRQYLEAAVNAYDYSEEH